MCKFEIAQWDVTFKVDASSAYKSTGKYLYSSLQRMEKQKDWLKDRAIPYQSNLIMYLNI